MNFFSLILGIFIFTACTYAAVIPDPAVSAVIATKVIETLKEAASDSVDTTSTGSGILATDTDPSVFPPATGEILANVMDSMSDSGSAVTGPMGDAMSGAKDPVASAIATVVEIAKLKAGQNQGSNSDAINSAADIVSDATENAKEVISEAVENAQDTLSDVTENISETVEKGVENAQEVLDDTSGVTSDVDGLISSAQEAAIDVIENLQDATSDATDNSKEAISDVIKDVQDATSDVIEDVQDATSDAIEDVQDATSNVIEDVQDATSDAIEDVQDATSDAIEDVQDATSDAIETVEEAMSEAIGNAEDAASQITDAIDDFVEDALDNDDDSASDLSSDSDSDDSHITGEADSDDSDRDFFASDDLEVEDSFLGGGDNLGNVLDILENFHEDMGLDTDDNDDDDDSANSDSFDDAIVFGAGDDSGEIGEMNLNGDNSVFGDERQFPMSKYLNKVSKVRGYLDAIESTIINADNTGSCPALPVHVATDKVTITTKTGCRIVIKLRGATVDDVLEEQDNMADDGRSVENVGDGTDKVEKSRKR